LEWVVYIAANLATLGFAWALKVIIKKAMMEANE